MILQGALRGWFGKGRRRSQEALEILRSQRESNAKRLEAIISRLDGEDQWFIENPHTDEMRCSCGPTTENRSPDP